MAVQPNEGPVGTKRTGYAETGPYRCGHCVHFDKKESGCEHPKVMADPDVPKLANGYGRVNALRGCCEYVRPPKRNDAERSGMRG